MSHHRGEKVNTMSSLPGTRLRLYKPATPIPPTLLRLFIDEPGGRLARHLFLTFREVWNRLPEQDRAILREHWDAGRECDCDWGWWHDSPRVEIVGGFKKPNVLAVAGAAGTGYSSLSNVFYSCSYRTS
jgi:hypothetical protein